MQVFVKFPIKFWGDEEWIIHAHERRGYFPVFMNAEAAGLFPTGTNMLVGFVVDEEARRVEHQPDWETKAEIEQVNSISFHFISFHFISFHFISFHFISFHFMFI